MKKLQPKDLKPTVGGRELTEAKRRRRRTADAPTSESGVVLTTAGLCGSGTVGAFAVGGVPLGASFAVGSAGALFYVKLLASKAEAGGGGQGGPPSILVPVILFMALNRWNFFFADDVGVTLSPIPMLLVSSRTNPRHLQAFRDILEEEQNGDGDNRTRRSARRFHRFGYLVDGHPYTCRVSLCSTTGWCYCLQRAPTRYCT